MLAVALCAAMCGYRDGDEGEEHRVEDALQATRAALEEGIVPGGGVALLQASAAVNISENGASDGRL